MLNNISWASYVLATSISVLIYYIFVLLLYYRRELQNIFVQHHKDRSNTTSGGRYLAKDIKDNEFDNVNTAATNEGMLLPQLLFVIEDLLKTGAHKNSPKEEILLSVKLELQQYPTLKNPNQQETINQYILRAFESICSIHLSGEEIGALWIK